MSVTDNEVTIFETTPAATALVAAVADHDPDRVGRILHAMSRQNLYAMAVILAANVAPEAPLGRKAGLPIAPETMCDLAIGLASGLFDTTPDAVLGLSRARNVLDARASAMAACRLVGLSSTFVGDHFDRDHTTVLHAAGRVGEDARLRRIANSIARQVGDRSLFDEGMAS